MQALQPQKMAQLSTSSKKPHPGTADSSTSVLPSSCTQRSFASWAPGLVGVALAETWNPALECFSKVLFCHAVLRIAHIALKRSRCSLTYVAIACAFASATCASLLMITSVFGASPGKEWITGGSFAGQVLVCFAVVPYAAAVMRRTGSGLRYSACAMIPAVWASTIDLPSLTSDGQVVVTFLVLAFLVSAGSYPFAAVRFPRHVRSIPDMVERFLATLFMSFSIGVALLARGVTAEQTDVRIKDFVFFSILVSDISDWWRFKMQQRPNSRSDIPAAAEDLPPSSQLGPRSDAQEQPESTNEAAQVIMSLGVLVGKVCGVLTAENPDALEVTPTTLNDALSSLIERAARIAREVVEVKEELEAMRSAHREVARDAQAELAAVRLNIQLQQRQHDEALRIAKHKRAELIKQMKDEQTEHAAQVTRLEQQLHAKLDELAVCKAKLRAAVEHAAKEETLGAQLTTKVDAISELDDLIDECNEHSNTADEASVSADTTAAPQYESTMGESATVAQVAD